MPPVSTRSSSRLRSNLRYCTLDGIFATPWAFLVLPSSFILAALLTQHFKVEPMMYGIIASLPFWSNALQILGLPLITRFLSPRDMALGISWLNVGVWLTLCLVLPFVSELSPVEAGWLFLFYFSLTSLSQSFLGLGWITWVQEWIPTRLRGKYFGARNRIINLMTLGYLLFCALVLHGEHDSLWPYLIVILPAVLSRAISVLMQYLIQTPNATTPAPPHTDYLLQFTKLRRTPAYVRYMAFVCLSGFGINLTGPFIPVFVYEHLLLSPSHFTMLAALATLSAAASLRLWGWHIDRHGCISALFVSGTAWQLQNYLWCLMTPETAWMLYLMWTWGGMASAGWILASFNLLLKIVPKDMRSLGVSLNLSLGAIATGLAPLAAGYALEWAKTDALGVESTYRLLFAGAPTLVLLSLLLLRRIEEPEAPRQTSFLGAMRNMRHTLAAQGYTYFANIHLSARRRR